MIHSADSSTAMAFCDPSSISGMSAGTPPAGLYGRAEEIRVLSEALDALAAGRSAITLVEGEAGIGKTRLLAATLGAGAAAGACRSRRAERRSWNDRGRSGLSPTSSAARDRRRIRGVRPSGTLLATDRGRKARSP